MERSTLLVTPSAGAGEHSTLLTTPSAGSKPGARNTLGHPPLMPTEDEQARQAAFDTVGRQDFHNVKLTTVCSHLPQLHHATAEGVLGPQSPMQSGLHLEDWQVPPRLQDGMLSLRKWACQHSCGSELHLLEGAPRGAQRAGTSRLKKLTHQHSFGGGLPQQA